ERLATKAYKNLTANSVELALCGRSMEKVQRAGSTPKKEERWISNTLPNKKPIAPKCAPGSTLISRKNYALRMRATNASHPTVQRLSNDAPGNGKCTMPAGSASLGQSNTAAKEPS